MMTIRNSGSLQLMRFHNLDACNELTHFVTTRHGGVSSGAFASMNPSLTSGDSIKNAFRNREILCDTVPIPSRKIYAPHQIHKTAICVVDRHFLQLNDAEQTAAMEGYDAMVTQLPDVCIAISTADCVPILIYAPDKRVIAAVHAGWRGTVQKMASVAVKFLETSYGCDPKSMIAGIGPSIGPDDFEVGEEVVDAFQRAGADMQQILLRTGKKPHINLWKENRLQLIHSGLLSENIEMANISTYSCDQTFFSARRLGKSCGRTFSAMMLKSQQV